MDDHSMRFIEEYPRKGYILPENISVGSGCYYDVLYSSPYRFLLESYYKFSENEKIIETSIIDKLKNKILVDLGCGSFACNLQALAYQSNAKAYMGIDVNVDLTEYDDVEMKSYLRMQYGLSEQIKSHNTLIKIVFDDFENFLKRAPDKAGYNFTINGLKLTKSIFDIKNHLLRIMVPGNVIIGNKIENLNILDLLVGEYKHTEIKGEEGLFGGDSVNIYEKLNNGFSEGTKAIKESIVLTLKR